MAVQLRLSLMFAFLLAELVMLVKTPEEIEEQDIVLDTVDHPSKHELTIKYVYNANFGNDVARPFSVRFSRGVDDFFTFLMIDPDQPSRLKPEESAWVHWFALL